MLDAVVATASEASPLVDGEAAGSEIDFLLRFLSSGHAAGYSTAELEERGVALADALGLTGAQVSVTPTLVGLSIGPLTRQRTYTLRVRPPSLALGTIAALDELVQEVVDRSLDTDAAVARLEEIHGNPVVRPWPLVVGAYALAGAALAPVIGGGRREVVGAAAVGLVVGAIAVVLARSTRMQPVVAPIAAIAASFCAAVLAQLGLDLSPDLVALAALVTFLPGMTLTVGVRELATGHLQSGVANTANALVQLLGLVFGVAIGRSIAVAWFGPVGVTAPEAALTAPAVLGAAAAGLAFTVSLKARSRDVPVLCAAAVLAILSNDVGGALLGKQAGVFGAAFVVGVAGGLVGFALRRSPLVFLVPGVLMLVPGSAGFNSALSLLTHKTVSGVATTFDTFVTAISIAYGLMIATVVLPRSLTQVTRREESSRSSD
jgi:uncharacterized membrane protein YjjP (DUF1212 family)